MRISVHSAERYFSPDYATAQRRFREAVAARGGRLDSLMLTAKGPAEEDLAINIGWFGAVNPKRALVHSSGLHGVEAFAGSAIQLRWLEQGIRPLREDAAIVLVHVLNPHGMAWLRRVNENNVDLNRNFLAPHETLCRGARAAYGKLDGFLNPTTPPSPDGFYLRAACLVGRHGMPMLKQALAGGQSDYPQGLFFGGTCLEEGPAKFQEYIANRLSGVHQIVAIDIHTGLGRFGYDTLLVDPSWTQPAVNQTMRAIFGTRVQVMHSMGVAYKVRGAQHHMYYRLFPDALVHFATQEFGTYGPLRVVEALRAENRWHHYGAGTIDHATKTKLREVFNPDDPTWRRLVVERGQEVISQGLSLAFDQSRNGGPS